MDILMVLLYVVSVLLAHLASNCALRETQKKHSFASGPLDGGSTTLSSGTPDSTMPTNHRHGPETNEKRKNRTSRPSRTTTAKVAVSTEDQGNGRKSRLNTDRVDRWRSPILGDTTNVQAGRPTARFAYAKEQPPPFSAQFASPGNPGKRVEPPSKVDAATRDDIGRSHKATTERHIDDTTEKFARFYKAITEYEQERLRKRSMNRPTPAKVPRRCQESPVRTYRLTKEQEKEIDSAFTWISSLTSKMATPATTGEITEEDRRAWQEVLQAKANIARLVEEDKRLTEKIEATWKAIEEKDTSQNTMESPNVQATPEQEHGQGMEMLACESVAQLKPAQTGCDCSPERANSQKDPDHAQHKGSEQKEEKVPVSSPTTLNTDMPETPSTTVPLSDQASGVEPTAEQGRALEADVNRLEAEKEKLAIQLEAILMAAEQEEEASESATVSSKARNAVPAPEVQAGSTQASHGSDPDQVIDAEDIPDDLYEVDSHFGSPFDSPTILPVDGSVPEPAPLPEDVPVAGTQEPTISSPPRTPVPETDQTQEINSLKLADAQTVLNSSNAVAVSDDHLEQLAQKLEVSLSLVSPEPGSRDLAALVVPQPAKSQQCSASGTPVTDPEVQATRQRRNAEGTEESTLESATGETDQEHIRAEQVDADAVPDDLYDEVDSHFGSPFDSPTMLPVDSSVPEPAPWPEDVPVTTAQGPTISSPAPISGQETDLPKTDMHPEQGCTSEDNEDVDAEGIPDDLDDVDSHFGSPFDSPEILPADGSVPEPAPWPEDGPDIPQQTEQNVEAAANEMDSEDEEEAVEKELEPESEDSDMPSLITPSLEVSRPAVNEPASVFDVDSAQVISCVEKDDEMDMFPPGPEARMEYDEPAVSAETMDADFTRQSASLSQILIRGCQTTADRDEDMQDAVPNTTQEPADHSMPVEIEVPQNAPALSAPPVAFAQAQAMITSMSTQQHLPRTNSIEMDDVAPAVPHPASAQQDIPKIVIISPTPTPPSAFATQVPRSSASSMQMEPGPSTLAVSSTPTQRMNGSLAPPVAETSTSSPPSNASGPSSTDPSASASSNSKSIWSRVQHVPLKLEPPILASSSNSGASSSSSSYSPLASMESMRSSISMIPIVPRSAETRTAPSFANSNPQPPATSTSSFRRSAVPVRSDTASSKIQAMRQKSAQPAQVDADMPSPSSSSATALGKRREEAPSFPLDIGNTGMPVEALYNLLFDEDGNPRPVRLPSSLDVSLDEDKENEVPRPGPSSLDKGKGKEICPAPEIPKEDPFSFFENTADADVCGSDEDKENAAPVPGPSVIGPPAVGPSSASSPSLDAAASRVQVNPHAELRDHQIKAYQEMLNDPDEDPLDKKIAEALLQGEDV